MSHKSYYLMLVTFLVLSFSQLALAQSAGPIDPAKEPGPKGSYSQSGYENVNLYNGSLDVSVPLMEVVGRGDAKYSIRVALQTHQWDVANNFFTNPDGSSHYNNVPFGTRPDLSNVDPYGPGLLEVVTGFDGAAFCVWTGVTRVVLRTPNGSELELRDDLTDGHPDQQTVCPGPWTGLNRGKNFHASDGSGITFVSDADVVDQIEFPFGSTFPSGVRRVATGTLIMRDGVRYRYELGILKKVADRNGNTLVFDYEAAVRRLSRITDSLGRMVNFTYGDRNASQFSDQISYTGFGGAPLTITVNFKPLSQALRPDQTLKNPYELFPNVNRVASGLGDPYDPKMIASVVFPNNKQYLVAYNSYAEVARFTVPAGGHIDYEYGGIGPTATSFFTFPDDTGIMWSKFNEISKIQRRLKERRTYSSSTQLEGTSRYLDIGMLRPVPIDHLNSSGGIIFTEKHYFFTSEMSGNGRLNDLAYVWWKANREFKTEWLNSAAQVQRTVEYNWQQRAPVSWYTPGAFLSEEPSNDPRVADITSTLNDSGQVSKKVYTYDQFNNITEEQLFDFGQGAPGALLIKTQTDYVTVNPVNSLDYTGNTIHLLSLPKQIRVYGLGSSVPEGRTDFEYDNYNDDTNNKPLVPRASITGLDSVPSVNGRGNLTKTQYALNVATGDGPKTYVRYDVAGNAVSQKDPLGFVKQTEFADAFSDSIIRNTFAYPTLFTSPIPDSAGVTGSSTPLTRSAVYDFNTGLLRQSIESNGLVTSKDYDTDGRVTRIVRPAGGGETDYEYSDVPGNVFFKQLIQLDATRFVESRTYFDGLGKSIRSFERTGVGATPWTVRDIHYDEVGRISSVLEPYNVATPGPIPGACGQCTVTNYDAMSRVTSVTTPDGSTFQTSYLGNATTTTDQTGKSKKVIKDALGRTKEVIEDPANLAQSTTFDYDTHGSIRRIVQAQQQRFFAYDSLSRLIRVRNVEDDVNSNLPAFTDPLTSNSQWSRAMQYDDNGNLTQQTDSRGVVTTFTYDRLNRNVGITYAGDPSGSLPVTRIFDFAVKGKGKLYQTKKTGAGGVQTTFESYNDVGSPVTVSQRFDVAGTWSQPYTVTYGYNLSAGVTSITYPSGRSVSYHYDDNARMDSVTGNLGDTTNRNYSTGIAYTPAGEMSQELFGTTTPVYNKRFYNSRHQLAEILASTTGNDSTWNRGKILNQFSLQCSGASCNATDNNGNVRKQEMYIPANDQVSSFTSWYQQFDYDTLNRLVRVHEFTGNPARDWQQEYQYDRWSNRTIHQTNTWGPNIPKPNFGVDPANNNRLTAPAGFSMTYDHSGNVNADTYSGILERIYDSNGRMTSAKDSSNVVQTYGYDPDGRRVRRNINGIETWQIFGFTNDLLAEYPANGGTTSPQKEYVYRNGELLVVAESSSPGGAAPTALAVTPPTAGTNLTLNWTAAAGATKYRVERKGAGGAFASIGTTTTTSLIDNSAVSGNAYLYKVCSADASGACTSNYSNIAMGAAITFTDPTIISIVDDPTGVTVTSLSAVHITQLRTAVNAVRTLAGLPNATYTYSSIAVGQLIHVEDVREMRSALDAALIVLGVTTPTYTDPNIKGFIEDPINATTIKAAHIRELRLGCTKGTGGSGGAAGGSVFTLNWMITDHLGTPRIVIDLSGSLSGVRRFDYLPFGEELNASHGIRDTTAGYTATAADHVRQKFTQKERDTETGLDYFGARYYSSVQGRFTGPDSIGGKPENPQTLNLYLYVNNNPLRAVDPTGNWTFDVTAAFFFQDQKDPQKPTTPPEIITVPKPGPHVKVKIIEIGIYDEQAEMVKDANKWIMSQLLFKTANPFSLQGLPPGPIGGTPVDDPRPRDFWERLVPTYRGISGGVQAGLILGQNGFYESRSYGIGVFDGAKRVDEFYGEGSFDGLAKHNWGLLATIGAGLNFTVSNATDPSEMSGAAQTITLATPTLWGGEIQWSYNARGEFVYTASLSVGKSFGGGIATFKSYTSPVQWFLPARSKQ